MKGRSESRTLLMSVIMSAPGPLVVGLGLIAGRSSTQLADFFRRSTELLAIICSFVVYRITNRDGESDPGRRARLERMSGAFVGAAMCVSGVIMLLLALFSESGEKGNVIPGLAVAVLGVVANTIFWRKYSALNRKNPNAIMEVQSRLYGAKALVDGCVTAALAAVALFPDSAAAGYLDVAGSAVVAVYMIWCGVRTIRDKK